MKKAFAVVLAALCLLCGCQKVGNWNSGRADRLQTPVPNVFSAQLTITQYGEERTAQLRYAKDGETVLAYSAPESVNGMELCQTPSGVRYSFLGLQCAPAENTLPPGNVLKILQAAFSTLETTDGYTIRTQGNTIVYSIEADGVPLTLYRERESLAPTAIEAGAYDCRIAFSAFMAAE